MLFRSDTINDDAGILENKIKELNLKEKSSQEEKEEKGKEQEKDLEENTNKEQGDLSKEWRYTHHHPEDLIIGDYSQGIKTRASHRYTHDYLAFVSQIESKYIEEAEKDSIWMLAMQEELN